MIQYYYPYKYLIEENWNTVLPKFIPKFINATSELEYKLNVLSLLTDVHDTHANIWMNDSVLSQYRGNNKSFINLAVAENKVVIKKILNKDFAEKKTLQQGDIILKINNKNVEDLIKEKLPYTSGSNYPEQLFNIVSTKLLRTNDTLLNITYQRGDVINTTSIPCFPPDKISMYKEEEKQDTCFSYAAPNIIRIYPGSIKNEYLKKAIPTILKSKGIIIDMRCYPSEPIIFSLGAYLMPQETPFAMFTEGSIKTPGLFSFNETYKVGQSNPQYYKGKVVIIVDANTLSQAEFTSMALRLAPKATVIGNTTAGADGDICFTDLPGGIKIGVGRIGVYYPDGRETQRVGIVPPDIEVKPTIKGIKEGRDELVEKAIEIINTK